MVNVCATSIMEFFPKMYTLLNLFSNTYFYLVVHWERGDLNFSIDDYLKHA